MEDEEKDYFANDDWFAADDWFDPPKKAEDTEEESE